MHTLLHTVPCLVVVSMLLSACGNMSKRQLSDSHFMASMVQHQRIAQDANRFSDCSTINESPACGTI